ncbi:MAG TPA: hypothetical protein VK111_15590 [Virgibacillus sp.]|nr:hypothetical protein [Virgibacillus sp.]
MENKTILGLSLRDKVIFIVVASMIGSVAGYFIKIIAKWAAKIPILPFSGILERIADWDSTYAPIIGVVIGLLAGIVFCINAFNETLHMTVTDEAVTFRFREKEETFNASDIGTVYMDNKVLVVLNRDGAELYRGKPDASRLKIADAFRHHDYRWEEQDPYYNQYKRWVPDHPDFSGHVNAMLAGRKKMLKDKKTEEAENLRKVLTKDGIVIRDKKKHQYVRMVNAK